MPEKTLDLDVGPDGVIRSIYDDKLNDFAKDIGGELAMVCRLSNVEWEEINSDKGWTVRAAHNSELALRVHGSNVVVSEDPKDRIVVFRSRETALNAEKILASQLMPPKETK